jgi:hypothetical protein
VFPLERKPWKNIYFCLIRKLGTRCPKHYTTTCRRKKCEMQKKKYIYIYIYTSWKRQPWENCQLFIFRKFGTGTLDRSWSREAPVSWPPRSPDISPIDLYLWGTMKNAVTLIFNKIFSAYQPRQMVEWRKKNIQPFDAAGSPRRFYYT